MRALLELFRQRRRVGKIPDRLRALRGGAFGNRKSGGGLSVSPGLWPPECKRELECCEPLLTRGRLTCFAFFRHFRGQINKIYVKKIFFEFSNCFNFRGRGFCPEGLYAGKGFGGKNGDSERFARAGREGIETEDFI